MSGDKYIWRKCQVGGGGGYFFQLFILVVTRNVFKVLIKAYLSRL